MCADDPQIAYHAQRNLTRIGLGTVALRWTQSGFLGVPGKGRTPRNLMGFKDGTANLDASDAGLMRSNVWAAASDGQAWIAGGSYLVSRRVRIRIEAWDRTPIGEQESIFGRRKGNGAPFGGSVRARPGGRPRSCRPMRTSAWRIRARGRPASGSGSSAGATTSTTAWPRA